MNNYRSIVFLVLLVGIALVFTRCDDDELIWMTYTETQCADPWDQVSGNTTEDQVITYLTENEVEVYVIEISHYSDGPFCAACTCPSGNSIKVQIDRSDRGYLVSLGFTD